MKAKTYNTTGKEAGSITLPEALFAQSWNADLVHEVVTSMQSNARTNVAHTKDRSEVRGGGKKPWRQKGTGRARHGSIRSPLWVGGGVTFGPRNNRNYNKKINQKAKLAALASTLSQKYTDGEVFFLESYNLDAPKTKEVKELFKNLSQVMNGLDSKKHNAVCVVVPESDESLRKSFANVDNVQVAVAKDLNPVHILSHKYLLIVNPDVSLKALEERLAKRGKQPVVKKESKKDGKKIADSKKVTA